MTKKKILITGANGYIGERLFNRLKSNHAFEVIGVSRSPKTSEIIFIDWNDVDSIKRACKGIETIVHLAAMNASDSAKDPTNSYQANVVNTSRLFEAAKAENVRRFIYASTAHVYGSPLIGNIDEGALTRPMHPYSIGHKAAEDIVLSSDNHISGVVLRFANGYGAPISRNVDCWSLFVNDLCRQITKNGVGEIRSNPSQMRNFISLENIVNSIIHVINLSEDHLSNRVFNVGSMSSMRLSEMAHLIQQRSKALLGFKPNLIFSNKDDDSESKNLVLNYSICKLASTGFIPKQDEAEEIDQLLLYCHKLN